MALYMKQDFSPPILSRKWVTMQFRPNMLIQSRQHIISILESGLLFREDCTEVEQEAPSPEDVWNAAGGGWGGWLTHGEGVVTVAGVVVCLYVFPPRSFTRSTLINLAAYMSVPIAVRLSHRTRCSTPLPKLLASMQEYLWLARCAAACLKEYRALHNDIETVTAAVEATHTTLCRQQSEMSVSLARCSSALLGNMPWLNQDITWDAVQRDKDDSLMKIHHAFMVIQSTFLKHLAMAHFIPPYNVRMKYKNHNERIYWIHNVLLKDLTEQFKENLETLHRMYRMLKTSSFKDSEVKKSNLRLNNAWAFSEVHTDIARAALELKLALDRSNKLDIFLDACAMNNQSLEIKMLDNDIDALIEIITQSLKSVQNSQIRLRKMKSKFIEHHNNEVPNKSEEIESVAVELLDTEPVIKDEVFYFVKTDDDEDPTISQATDISTAPGKREKETTKIVLNELRRKLGKREDLMRERERQALGKTMPELKVLPEFPRQIQFDDFLEKMGFICKIRLFNPKKLRLFNDYKIHKRNKNENDNQKVKIDRINKRNKKFILKIDNYNTESDIIEAIYEANAKLNVKSKLLTVSSQTKEILITKWNKTQTQAESQNKNEKTKSNHNQSELETLDFSLSSLSEIVSSTGSKTMHQAENQRQRFSKKDLELSATSSESDFEYYNEQRQLLNEIRRHRVARKKNFPSQRMKAPTDNKGKPIDNVDESLKPVEYSLGTGLAMASVLQVNNPKFLNMAAEEVFVGDGEVSEDSGNDEDA